MKRKGKRSRLKICCEPSLTKKIESRRSKLKSISFGRSSKNKRRSNSTTCLRGRNSQ
jgi:hypothetical protein